MINNLNALSYTPNPETLAGEKLDTYEQEIKKPLLDLYASCKAALFRLANKILNAEHISANTDNETSIILEKYLQKITELKIESEDPNIYRLFRFMTHNMSSTLTGLSTIVSNAIECRDSIASIEESITCDEIELYKKYELTEKDFIEGPISVKDVLLFAKHAASAKKYLKIHGITEDDSLVVFGHGALLAEIINELIKNAENFLMAEKRTPSVTLRVRRISGNIEISIEDNGRGMSQDIQKRVFEKGFTTRKMGTGQGLYMIKKSIEETFKGEISLSSEMGKGTKIEILIPEYKQETQNIVELTQQPVRIFSGDIFTDLTSQLVANTDTNE